MATLSLTAPDGQSLAADAVRDLIAQACPAKDYKGRRVLLIVPDATRTCPLGLLFAGLHEQIGAATAAFDVMIALGTHQPMSEEAICQRLEITAEERADEVRAACASSITSGTTPRRCGASAGSRWKRRAS